MLKYNNIFIGPRYHLNFFTLTPWLMKNLLIHFILDSIFKRAPCQFCADFKPNDHSFEESIGVNSGRLH